MKHDSQNERLQRLLSQKKHKVAVRSANAPAACFMASLRCCAHGEWKLAAKYLTSTMNLIWTTIVHPKEGANRKN
ncbi:MAG: hypothetical protein CMJ26_07055 [Phycisphaerae bacterium]|nr:hypothetical protein [Phycisphaerae bacterium]